MAAGDEVRIRVRLQGARQAQQQARAAGQAMGEVGVETEQAGQKARKSAKDFDVVGKSMDGLKRMGAAAGLAAGGALSAGLMSTVNMDSANNKLSAQLGLSGPMSERAGRMAGELYREAWGDSVEHVNQALGSVMSGIPGMASASQSAIKALTGTALDFATAFEVDVTQAVATAGYLMEAGLARSGTEAFDLLTAASQRVPAALRGELLEASEEYSQFFGSLGYNGQQAFALLVDAAGKGRYGLDKTGDAIKEFSIRSTDMSTTSQEAYAAIGMDAQTMANKILAGGDSAYQGTQEIINGLLAIKDPAKQAEAAIALFGTPIEDLNVGEIPEFLKGLRGGSKSMDGFGGAAGRMGEAINQGPAYQFTLLKRALETFLGMHVIPFILAHKTAFMALGVSITAILALYGLYRVGVMAITLATVTAGAAQWLYANALLATRARLAFLAVTTRAAAAAQWALNLAMRANPILFIVTLLMVLGAALVTLYKKNEWFRNAVGAAWNWIKTAVSNTVNWIKTAWNNTIAFLSGLPGRARRALSGLWGGIKDAFRGALNWIIGKWNSFELGFGPVKVPGLPDIPRMAIGTPNIPMLAQGGVVSGAGSWITGDAGPELNTLRGGRVTVQPLSKAPDRVDVGTLAEGLSARPAPRDKQPLEVHSHLHLDGREIYRTVSRITADKLAHL